MKAVLGEDEPFIATDEEAAIASEAAEKIRPLADAGKDLKIRLVEQADLVMPLPARAVEMIANVLSAMAEKKPITVISRDPELTSQQAADFLKVSRPHLVSLIDKGVIKHRLVGTHRRITMSDLLDYKKHSDQSRRDAIRDMVEEAQKLELP